MSHPRRLARAPPRLAGSQSQPRTHAAQRHNATSHGRERRPCCPLWGSSPPGRLALGGLPGPANSGNESSAPAMAWLVGTAEGKEGGGGQQTHRWDGHGCHSRHCSGGAVTGTDHHLRPLPEGRCSRVRPWQGPRPPFPPEQPQHRHAGPAAGWRLLLPPPRAPHPGESRQHPRFARHLTGMKRKLSCPGHHTPEKQRRRKRKP